MRGILADNNAHGHVAVLVHILQHGWRQEFWASLNLSVLGFSDLALSDEVVDTDLWRICQEQQVALITQNRNARGPDSLEEVIRKHTTPQSLPVFTLADGKRIMNERTYAERVAERLLEYLLEIDKVRGSGRLYVP